MLLSLLTSVVILLVANQLDGDAEVHMLTSRLGGRMSAGFVFFIFGLVISAICWVVHFIIITVHWGFVPGMFSIVTAVAIFWLLFNLCPLIDALYQAKHASLNTPPAILSVAEIDLCIEQLLEMAVPAECITPGVVLDFMKEKLRESNPSPTLAGVTEQLVRKIVADMQEQVIEKAAAQSKTTELVAKLAADGKLTSLLNTTRLPVDIVESTAIKFT